MMLLREEMRDLSSLSSSALADRLSNLRRWEVRRRLVSHPVVVVSAATARDVADAGKEGSHAGAHVSEASFLSTHRGRRPSQTGAVPSSALHHPRPCRRAPSPSLAAGRIEDVHSREGRELESCGVSTALAGEA
jgi:hypothetical protein